MKYLAAEADLSDDGVFRYSLSRRLGMGERAICFVGLNPSTADALKDDPTIRREVDYSRRWGFDWFFKGNLYAFRATEPKDMWAAFHNTGAFISGPRNQEVLRWMVQKAEIVVAAWGGAKLDAAGRHTADWVLSLPNAHYLKLNDDGSPAHPLYLRKTLTPLRVAERKA